MCTKWRHHRATSRVKTIHSSYPAYILNNEDVCLVLHLEKNTSERQRAWLAWWATLLVISVSVHVNGHLVQLVTELRNSVRLTLTNKRLTTSRFRLVAVSVQTTTTPVLDSNTKSSNLNIWTPCHTQLKTSWFFQRNEKGITHSDQLSGQKFWYSPKRQTAHEVKSSRNNCLVEPFPLVHYYTITQRMIPLSAALLSPRLQVRGRHTDRQTAMKTHGSVSAPGKEVLDI